MKKQGGKQAKPATQKVKTKTSTATKSTAAESRESWRTWVLTTVALAFALLVITLLTQKNDQLMSEARILEAEIAEARALKN